MEITKNQFLEFLEQRKTDPAERKLRSASFEQFELAPYPSVQYGLSILIKPNIPKQIIIAPKSDWLIRCPEDVKCTFERKDHDDTELTKSKWSFLHDAFENASLTLDIPKGKGTQIVTLENRGHGSLFTTIRIRVQKNAQAMIFLQRQEGSQIASDRIIIDAEEGSTVQFQGIQNLPRETINIQQRISRLGRNAKANWIDLCLGSAYTRSECRSILEGEGSESKITVLFLGASNQKLDLFTESCHQGRNTTSNILTKGVLDEQAKGLSRGLVRIEKDAAGSNGYEKQDCLLLSCDAEADAIPMLEINNHDVKCSHGSTIGSLDAEQMFYLRSRGLSEQQAKQKIIEGYFNPVLANVPDDNIREDIQRQISASLEVGYAK